MNLKQKKVLITLISIFVLYIVGINVFTIKTGYNVEFGTYKEFLWLFKPDVQKRIDTLTYVKDYRKSDSYAHYNFGKASIGVHEIHDLEDINLSSIKFYQNKNLNNIDFYPAQEINKNVNVIPTIRAYWNISFDSVLNVNFNSNIRIDSVVRGDNYICYHAQIDKMLLSNGKNKEMMFFDFSNKSKNTLLLFLKKRNRFFILMVNSTEDFGIEELDIFNI